MSKKLKILLYADAYGDKVGINEAYVTYLSQFGDVILVMASNDLEMFIEMGDVLALPGGADINPARYGEFPYWSGRVNPYFEYLDEHLLKPWITTGKPIIGICRGLQALNVEMGGSLYQHVEGHVQSSQDRGKCEEDLFTRIEGFKLYKTNSLHHQAIKRLADGFEVIGWGYVFENCPSVSRYHSKEDKPKLRKVFTKTKEKGIQESDKYYYTLPEIIKHTTLPYVAFQYHPEEFNCKLANKLIRETLNIEESEEEPVKKQNQGQFTRVY